MERAGSAVELRPASKARSAAHPQERQHSAAEGGTECPRLELSVRGACAALRQGSSPDRAETRLARDDGRQGGLSDCGRGRA